MSTISNSVFSQVLLEGKLCDVVISVGNVEFQAHRIILCGCSSFFRNLFCTTPSEVYSFPDVPPNIMSLIMEYAYNSSVVVTEENVLGLLAAAHRFAIHGILSATSDFLEQKLCVENCIGTWMSAELYNCPDLRKKANLYILHHFEEVAGSSEKFLQLSVQQLAGLIKKDELNVRQESTVFEAILRWIDHNLEERKSHMAVLLSKVRLLVMSVNYLVDTVCKNNLVRTSLACVTMVSNAMKTLHESNMEKPLTCTRLPHTVLLTIGGWVKDCPTESVEIYDVRADRWVTLSNNGKAPRAFHGCVYLNGFVYCIGGFDNLSFLRSVRRLNLFTRSWQEVGPMNSVRCYVSVAVLNGCIYAMGGYDRFGQLNTVERYQPNANQWTMMAPMNDQRSNANATTLHGKIYICGGFNGEELLSSAECYNPQSNQWTMIASMGSGLNGAAVIAYKDLIYVVGGFNGVNCVNTVIAYDPVSHRWRAIPPMINSRSNFGIAVLEDQLYAVGGFENLGASHEVERYDGNSWKSVQRLNIPCSTPSCCVVERNPYFSTTINYQINFMKK
ncbi:kelch-like protein 10 [Scomber scombrus]|uniref:kelch-like protein 10 n=1 Tax=Scomber scombrus TaxID=13677 RepID=UPI002DD9164C|nr:kelch-like protein 10 [Scomber scombrus]